MTQGRVLKENQIMPAKIEMIDRVFGRLVVIAEAPKQGRELMYKCVCTCGNIIITSRATLRRGSSNSCGCLSRELTIERNTKHGAAAKGAENNKEYLLWKAMHGRCYNKTNNKYYTYGARGVIVCDRWHDFSNFFLDMGFSPEGKTLGRRDNDGPYSPENCRWETAKEQANNTTHNIRLTFENKTQTLSQWAEEYNIPYMKLYKLIKRNFSLAYCLSALGKTND